MDASITANLADLVRDRWAVLLDEGTFVVAEEEDGRVTLTSPDVYVVTTYDPRGEVLVQVSQHGREPWQRWRYFGMIGRAPIALLLDLALEAMQRDPAVLAGDAAFYDDLAAKAKTESEELTGFYSRRGPRPGKLNLP